MEAEKTRPNIFHIHLDTQTRSLPLHERFHRELNFFPHHFSGHPEGYTHFEPTSHSSIKLETKQSFEDAWGQSVRLVKEEGATVIGYLEGEYIPTDVVIPFQPVKDFFRPQFLIERRTLLSERDEMFRETEFHLVMDFVNSDQHVITALLDAGLYGALLEKQDHRAIVLSMQGHQRLIKPLMKEIEQYLKRVGGAVRCTMKEEVALRNQLFNMSVEKLPEIIGSIKYFSL